MTLYDDASLFHCIDPAWLKGHTNCYVQRICPKLHAVTHFIFVIVYRVEPGCVAHTVQCNLFYKYTLSDN